MCNINHTDLAGLLNISSCRDVHSIHGLRIETTKKPLGITDLLLGIPSGCTAIAYLARDAVYLSVVVILHALLVHS